MQYFGRFITIVSIFILVACQGTPTDSGTHRLVSPDSIDVVRARLIKAITDNGFLVSDGTCGKCSVKTIEVSEPDTEIITIYRPELSLRMMQAGSTAGSDAPLRFYLSRSQNGDTTLVYHQPSKALMVYNAPKLAPIAIELDAVFAKIFDSVNNRT